MKHILLICHLSFAFCHLLPAQVTFNVLRSEVLRHETYQLPAFPWSGPAQGMPNDTGYSAYAAYVSAGTPEVEIVSVTGTGMPGGWPPAYGSGTILPTIRIPTDAPMVFTNTIYGTGQHFDYGTGYSYGPPGGQQTYIFTITDDTQPPASHQYVILTGLGDTLESLSRKDASAPARKLVGFQLMATTNAVLNSLAFAISNTTTNSNPVENLSLIQDADGNGDFSPADTVMATTTNANGMALFYNVDTAITTNRATYFLTGTFQPGNQTRNSFISASLNPHNVQVSLAGTNVFISAMGGTVLGKQYAFLDTTQAEDDAAASALNTQIRSAVDSATNALTVAYNTQLATELANAANRSAADLAAATNALAVAYAADMAAATNQFSSQISTLQQQIQTGTGGSVSSPSESSLTKTLLPAAAAGAAAIGAAFTSDSLGKQPISREFSPSK